MNSSAISRIENFLDIGYFRFLRKMKNLRFSAVFQKAFSAILVWNC